MKLPSIIEAELERAEGRWSIEPGSRHQQVRIDGHLVAVMPRTIGSRNTHELLNVRAQIRRHLNQFPA
jgi:hypothetical protein